MVSMEIVWKQYGDCMERVWRVILESDTFHGDFMVKVLWRLPGLFIEKTW